MIILIDDFHRKRNQKMEKASTVLPFRFNRQSHPSGAIPPEPLMWVDAWFDLAAVPKSPAGLFALVKVDTSGWAPPHAGGAPV
jgi:hypothetical protein